MLQPSRQGCKANFFFEKFQALDTGSIMEGFAASTKDVSRTVAGQILFMIKGEKQNE